MKKPTARKLKLATETVRTLDDAQLAKAVGGVDWSNKVDLTVSGRVCEVGYVLFFK